ncbi:hypothetical protein GOP47_0000891 [Adiantum capillus-veneris]|uniref:Uncharacterized protein n=1 Tax=Adiantum capillus-veneris TaxID=13818 RepID=A0A9D4VEC9_ADICA|nr:hypothetical protein GOP47_0000891 [Adiantum capillus-veneris]
MLDSSNYKKIMVFHVLAKLYGVVLEQELSSYAESKGGSAQAGDSPDPFRPPLLLPLHRYRGFGTARHFRWADFPGEKRRMVSLLMVIVGTFLFAATLAAFFLFPRKSNGPDQGLTKSTTSKGRPQIFTASEVSKHNKANDCWIIIKNKGAGALEAPGAGKTVKTLGASDMRKWRLIYF